MSVRFDASSDYILSTSGVPNQNGFSFTFWMYIVTDRNAEAALCGVTDGSVSFNGVVLISDGTTLAIETIDGTNRTNSSTGCSTGTWYFVGFTRTTGNVSTLYLGTESSASSQVAQHTVSASFTPIGLIAGGNTLAWLNGRMAGFKCWTAALSAAEIETERVSNVTAARTANLNRVTPLTGSGDLADTSGNGYDWSAAGTLTTEADPSYPAAAGLKLPVALATYRRMRA